MALRVGSSVEDIMNHARHGADYLVFWEGEVGHVAYRFVETRRQPGMTGMVERAPPRRSATTGYAKANFIIEQAHPE
jgi:hypothetical protein